MKVFKKILLTVALIILAIQAPFVYRRFEIAGLTKKVALGDKERTVREIPGYREYKGVVHAHTSLGGHSTGSFTELIKAANANDLDFVAMTEHYDLNYDTSALTLNGIYGKTLFVNGQEVDTNDGGRYLLLPGTVESPGFSKLDSKTFLERIHSEGRIAINNYPERKHSDNTDFDGMEVYSLHINAKASNPFTALFDLIWSFHSYPEMTYATYFRRNDDYLRRYDAIASKKRLLLDAGADAHSNKGYYLVADDEGNKHFGFKIDPYETVFRLVRMHVLLAEGTPLTRDSLIDALRNGHAFVGFDVIGDTTGFSFAADNGTEQHIMGDEIALGSGARLYGKAPLKARFALLRDGIRISEFSDTAEFEATVTEPGTYRVEVYRDDLSGPFDKAPWIMSNPIYVR